jgi:hypothetical protein
MDGIESEVVNTFLRDVRKIAYDDKQKGDNMRMVDAFTSCITTNPSLFSQYHGIEVERRPGRILTMTPIISYVSPFDYNGGLDCEYAANLQKVSSITGHSYYNLNYFTYLVEMVMYRIVQTL